MLVVWSIYYNGSKYGNVPEWLKNVGSNKGEIQDPQDYWAGKKQEKEERMKKAQEAFKKREASLPADYKEVRSMAQRNVMRFKILHELKLMISLFCIDKRRLPHTLGELSSTDIFFVLPENIDFSYAYLEEEKKEYLLTIFG